MNTDQGDDPQSMSSWQRSVLYHHRVRSHLSNERKYVGWLRVSLGLVSLGFIVERLELVLARLSERPGEQVGGVLFWAPLVIFGLGTLSIVLATWDFFVDRSRIEAERPRGSRLLGGLILLTLVCVVLIAVLLWTPNPR